MVDDGQLVDGRNQAFSGGQARAEGPVSGGERDQVEGCSSESSLAAFLQLPSSPERIEVNLSYDGLDEGFYLDHGRAEHGRR